MCRGEVDEKFPVVVGRGAERHSGDRELGEGQRFAAGGVDHRAGDGDQVLGAAQHRQ